MNDKRILVCGKLGRGKSTLCNALYGEDLKKLKEPFKTSKIKALQDRTIIDTIGFGDPSMKKEFIFNNLKKAIEELYNGIDIIIFVIRKDRLTEEDEIIFDYFYEHIFENKISDNLIIYISQCNNVDDWIEKSKDNKILQKMLNSTNIKPIGYDFPDIEEHDDELEILYEQRRMERSLKLINDIFSINVERIRINC